MFTSQEFLARIEAFLKNPTDGQSWTATRFGREVMNDPNFVFELRRGRKVNLASAQTVLEFIEDRERAA